MADQLVCNINFFLYIRFVFGFYHEFQTFKSVQWLARCYCCLICTSFIFLFSNVHLYVFSEKYFRCLICMEYFVCVLISLLKSNKYVLQYYKKTPLIDVSASSYRPMRVCLVGYMGLLILFKFCQFIEFLINELEEYSLRNTAILFNIYGWLVISIARSPFLFVFALLYNRVKLMRQRLESNDFDYKNYGEHHPRRYIQMYEAIMDLLEASNNPVKLQFFIFIVFFIAHYLFGTCVGLYYMKNNNNINIMPFLWFTIETIISSLPLIFSAILADLLRMEVRQMLFIVLMRRISCKNERDRDEIQKLFQYLKRNPFDYSLWRVVPLNVRSLLSFNSFVVTTIIAILQAQGGTNN